MTQILDGKKSAENIYYNLSQRIQNLKAKGIVPYLAVVLVGDDPASQIYVKRKEKIARQIGLLTKTYELSEKITENELLELIIRLNLNQKVHGILVQFPLPKHIDESKIVEKIIPDKDVDGFNPYNVGKLIEGKDYLAPCTPKGIMTLLDDYKINLEGKNCVVIGRSLTVGKPMSTLLLHQNATVTICHSKTKDINVFTRHADVIIVAVGIANFLKPEMIKSGAILVDVGINRTDKGIVGDVDPKCYSKASFYTPVPGGVGQMTIAMLMEQTVEIAENMRE